MKIRALLLLASIGVVVQQLRADDVPYLNPEHNQVQKEAAPAKTQPAVEGYIDPTTTRLSEFMLGSYQYCGSDRDCMVATNGCCDCANGGEDVAINTLRKAEFRKRFECGAVKCGMSEATLPCGSGLVSCVNHKCRYTPPQKE